MIGLEPMTTRLIVDEILFYTALIILFYGLRQRALSLSTGEQVIRAFLTTHTILVEKGGKGVCLSEGIEPTTA